MARLALLALLGFAATASAQTPADAANPWKRCTTLEVFAGAADASPNTTSTVGAGLGWELTHRVEIEGVAAWLPQRQGAEAFAADLKLLINLTRPSIVVPYIGGGAGLFRGSFDTGRTSIPEFYRRRIEPSAATTRMTFTDPTAVVAAGVHVYVARHLSVRPEVAVRFVTDDSRTYRVTSVVVALAYHAEEHAIGNAR